MKNYCVYKHTCPNGKVYIGITNCDPLLRWRNSGAGYSRQIFFRAIQKYGWDNIQHEIICEGLSKEEAEAKEIELITLYQSNNRNFGYNISGGGEGFLGVTPWNKGGHISEETKEKIRRANIGKKTSAQTRMKLSLSKIGNQNAKGNVLSEETRKKISSAVSGEKNPFYGKKHSKETKEKMKKNHADFSKSNHPQAKKVICVTTGETFDCVQDAADKFGLSYGQVKCNCQGKTKRTGKSFVFMYLKGDTNESIN